MERVTIGLGGLRSVGLRFWLLWLALLAAPAKPAAAQTVLHLLEGELAPLDDLGRCVVGLDDLDGDGRPEFLVTAPGRWHLGAQTGAAVIYSGASGQILRTHHGALHADRIGNSAIRTGDLNGDGIGDYAVGTGQTDYGASNGGSVYFYSGADGVLIRRVDGNLFDAQLGNTLCSLGDVDGDGIDDVAAAGWRSQTVNGYVRVISGATGATILTQAEPYPYENAYEVRVAGIGDVNGDSFGDLAIGSCRVSQSAGEVRIVSGSTGGLIRQLPTPGGEFGTCVAPAGDVDGDGVGDLMASAPWAQTTGRVFVYSGSTGAVLRTFTGEAYGERFGQSAVPCGDMDGDGIGEFAIAATFADNTSNNSGRVRVFLGSTGSTLYTFDGDDNGHALGLGLAGLGDVNGDGFADLAASQVGDQPGSVKVFSGTCSPPPGHTYCIGRPNSATPGASIGYLGSTSISANNFSLTVSGCPPNKVGLFLFAPHESQFAFGNGFKCVTGDYTRRIQPAVITGPTGAGGLPLNLTLFPTNFLPGANPKFQFWYRDPPAGGAGFNTSDALSISFCP